MSFKDIQIKHSYSSERDNLLQDFYIPVLANAVNYRRITGYFSSTSFAAAAVGLARFIENRGHLRFILNVILTQQDYEQIELGLKSPAELVGKRLLDDLKQLEKECKNDHARILGWLIANDYLEIKIGYVRDKRAGDAILHQKVGILQDADGNIVTFSGSNNESAYGWSHNSEQFKVFKSWESGHCDYIKADQTNFLELWNDISPKTRVIPFPQAAREHLIETSPKDYDEFEVLVRSVDKDANSYSVRLRDYQEDAIDKWFNNGCRGIFEMATGTGKTYTAIGALKRLLNTEKKIVVIISYPFLHLISQWEDSLCSMDIELPTIVASGSSKKWQTDLWSTILDNGLGRCDRFVIFTTHKTLALKRFIDLTEKIECPVLLIGDEVHGLGATGQSEGLLPTYKYRLGLSATPERYFDEVGSDKLRDYFNDTVYIFSLKSAITEKNPSTGESYLVPYDYHPLFVELTADEMEDYSDLTQKIGLFFGRDNRSKEEDRRLERLLMKRQDIVKNASNKYSCFLELLNLMNVNEDISHTLVYCSPEQIDRAQEIIRATKGVNQHKFTSGEDAVKKRDDYGGKTERAHLLSLFDQGIYHVLVAMKCLDEGVDIPSTKNAILMCSSGNPREYIQRRGRVLRRYPGKRKAIIYDICALPNYRKNQSISDIERGVVRKQLDRIIEFAEDASNRSEVSRNVFRIKERYNI